MGMEKLLQRDTWQQYMRDSIAALEGMRCRVVEIEGDLFWMCIPSEAILYGIGLAEKEKQFKLEVNERWAGHLVYSFYGNPDETYQLIQDREIEFVTIRYISKDRNYPWMRWGKDWQESRKELVTIGEDFKFPDGKHWLENINTEVKNSLRLMLVPITRDGHWDTTFSQSVPDGDIVKWGILRAEYMVNGKPVDRIYGGTIDNGKHVNITAQQHLPPEGKLLSINLESENNGVEPIHWRSFSNVLVCTQQFNTLGMTLEEYNFHNLLPKYGEDQICRN